MAVNGLRSSYGVGAPPFTKGPYTWDQQVTFTAGLSGVNTNKNVLYVDGTNGSDGNDGKGWNSAKATIQGGVDAAVAGDTIFIAPKAMVGTDTDPANYAETIIIDVASLSLIGISRGRTQGGLPQIKKGSGSTALLTIRTPGCLIANIGFNGGSSTGGGILLDDDGGSTKSAFGTTIMDCHFKNCVGSTATNAATGGAIQWASAGNAWQVWILRNRFYKNVGDIVLLGTTGSVPQDVVIEDNVFSGPAASVDCNLYLAGGSGMNGVIIRNNVFTALPAIGSGTNATYMDLTGCIGVLVGNMFADNGTTETFKAAGTVKVPATVFMAGNYREAAQGTSAEIGRAA